jgi:hypothetical protein
MTQCNKWLQWAYVEAAWVAVRWEGEFKTMSEKRRAMGKKANTAIIAVAQRLARISWPLLTEGRKYEKTHQPQSLKNKIMRREPKPKTANLAWGDALDHELTTMTVEGAEESPVIGMKIRMKKGRRRRKLSPVAP